jgi:hypothetical protein
MEPELSFELLGQDPQFVQLRIGTRFALARGLGESGLSAEEASLSMKVSRAEMWAAAEDFVRELARWPRR